MNRFQKRMDEAFKKMEAIRVKAEAENRNLTSAEMQKRSEYKAEIEAARGEWEQFKSEEELRKELYGDPSERTGPLTVAAGEIETHFSGDHRTISKPRGRDYRSLFGIEKNAVLDNGGWKDPDEFLSVIHSGRSDSRLKLAETRGAMSVGEAPSLGWAVPEILAAWTLDTALESEVIRSRATVWPMFSMTLKCPGWNMLDHVNGMYGGLDFQWLAENGTAVESQAMMRYILLKANKGAIFTSSSNELLADGINIESQISVALTKTVAFGMDYGFIQGTGVGQPLGILNDPALIVIPKEQGQKAGTILYENCVRAMAQLAPFCLSNAVWLASNTCLPQMLLMSIAIGTGGAFIPAVTSQSNKFFLLGKEILFTEKNPALGNKGDLILCDISQYAIGLRREVSFERQNVSGWLQDQSSFRAIVRVDGQGTWNAPISPKHGDPLSWCVALADRK